MPIKSLTLVLVLGLISFASCGLLGKDEPDPPDIPGTLVFSAKDNNGDFQIFSMNANGTGLRQLTHFKADEAFQPSWSPDGSKIVFTTTLNSSSNGFSIYIMNADGSGLHPMNDRPDSPIPTPGSHPQWSPDGSKIAFDLCVNCQVATNREIFIYDFATDRLIQLTHTDYGVSNFLPKWSPDGSQILFISDRINPYDPLVELYLAALKENSIRRVTKFGLGGFCWLDEERIVYTIHKPDIMRKELYIKNIEANTKNKVSNIQAYLLWLFYNKKDNTLLSIDKKYGELPLTIKLYNLEGQELLVHTLKKSIFKSADSFAWINTK